MLTKEELREVASVVRDMRFIQAAALVSSKLADEKKARSYMARLNFLQDKLDKLETEAIAMEEV